jgi:predicted Holliday junction resolvase-like endonuclease
MTTLAFVMLLLAVGLITSTEHQQRQISELKTELEKKASEIERLQNKNSAQDIILNKLNAEYQMKERQKAEEAKRIADANGVGG